MSEEVPEVGGFYSKNHDLDQTIQNSEKLSQFMPIYEKGIEDQKIQSVLASTNKSFGNIPADVSTLENNYEQIKGFYAHKQADVWKKTNLESKRVREIMDIYE